MLNEMPSKSIDWLAVNFCGGCQLVNPPSFLVTKHENILYIILTLALISFYSDSDSNNSSIVKMKRVACNIVLSHTPSLEENY